MDVDEFIRSAGNAKTVNAGFFQRVAGFVIDLLVLNIFVFASFAIMIPKGFTVEKAMQFTETGIPSEVLFIVFIAGLFALAYFSLLEYGAGATVGMIITGTRVNGGPGFWKCVVRNIFIIPFFPFTIFWILDPIYLLWRKQRLLEIFTGTETQRA